MNGAARLLYALAVLVAMLGHVRVTLLPCWQVPLLAVVLAVIAAGCAGFGVYLVRRILRGAL